ncbi:MAG TPA: hypothetical protein VLG67_01965 [Candidatus Saccharimonadales bacterium]|nr:hypothetical protein [Candidatus Saccharimonadales bacterium]
MNLQDTFYILGIVFMTMSIVILIAMAILLFYIMKKVTEIHKYIDAKMEDISSITSPVKNAFGFATSFFSNRAKKKKSTKR